MDVTATSTSPGIKFDEPTQTLRIWGESYPENAFEFYRPLLKWLDARVNTAPLTVEMDVTYMNTSSVKCVIDMFDRLEEGHQAGGAVCVVWRHRVEDERARELGEEFKEDLTLPFEMHAYA
ncbi:MAG: DUF1987 domain-containing protein [Deltaproteobacteria bacterium]|nr:DUF1987 domain-containing protein [Deltaproteobacteria bacterium]